MIEPWTERETIPHHYLLIPPVSLSSILPSNFHAIIQWTVITIPGNRFCWSVMQQITDQAEAREQRFRNSEWGPEANEELIEAVHAFPVTFGGTLGEIIDATPKDRISKVMLEEKLFDTWYHENVVLIGDGKSTGGCCFFLRKKK